MATWSDFLPVWGIFMLLGLFNYVASVGLPSLGSLSLSFLSNIFSNISTMLSSLVAIEHVGFFVMECFFWENMSRRLKGRRGVTRDEIKVTQPLASNQGIYNLGTAICLFWSVYNNHNPTTIMVLLCIIMYAIFGAFTVNIRIFYAQGVPAILALIFAYFNG